MAERLVHPIPPLFDNRSRVLILGSFPSPKSREHGFFYGHPQNRFWGVLAHVLGEENPASIPEKREMALRNHVALWDVIHACEIVGADDNSIRNPIPNTLHHILDAAPIQAVFTTGRKAHTLFQKLITPDLKIEPRYLPSPSPANCAMSFERLVQAYRAILEFLPSTNAAMEVL